MKGYVYILKCSDGTYYTGSTINIERRFWEHSNLGGAEYTRHRQPVELVYLEEFDKIEDAFYREKQIQGWGRAKKEALIRNNFEDLITLSKNYTEYANEVKKVFLERFLNFSLGDIEILNHSYRYIDFV